MTQHTARLGDGGGYRCGRYTIRTQDNREKYRHARFLANVCRFEWPITIQRWHPSPLWRLAHWWRRLTGQRRSV